MKQKKKSGVNTNPQTKVLSLINFDRIKVTKSSKVKARQLGALERLKISVKSNPSRKVREKVNGKIIEVVKYLHTEKDLIRIWKEIYTLEYKLGLLTVTARNK